jgi:hypothetical protein
MNFENKKWIATKGISIKIQAGRMIQYPKGVFSGISALML